MSKVSRLLYQAAGWSVGVATLGLFLPLLPTTPFLLVASMCFVRSSPQAHGCSTAGGSARCFATGTSTGRSGGR